MFDFFCPWCGDFTFETVICLHCDSSTAQEQAEVA